MKFNENIIIRFIGGEHIHVSPLSDKECESLIIEEKASSEIPTYFNDLFYKQDIVDILDEHGNTINQQYIPKKKILSTSQLLAYYRKKQCYRYQNLQQIYLNNQVLSKVRYSDDHYRAILFHSFEEFKKCYNNFSIEVDKNDFVYLQTYHYDQKAVEAYLQQGTQQLLATYSDDFHQSYLCEDDYYFVVHQKPYRAILFNTFEGFKKYIDFLPYGD